jgi:hypothetical protein
LKWEHGWVLQPFTWQKYAASLVCKQPFTASITWLGAEEFWTSQADTGERDLRQKNGYPQVYFDFLANVVQHDCQDLIVPIPNTSFIGHIILKNRGVLADLIYIDGSHVYEDVKSRHFGLQKSVVTPRADVWR